MSKYLAPSAEQIRDRFGQCLKDMASYSAADGAGGTPYSDNDAYKVDNYPMSDSNDYRNELKLRDEQLRREMDIRQESFRVEQAIRDKALEDRFAGFLAAQVERDKAWEKTSEARFDRIEKDVSGIKADTKKVSEDINGIKVTMAKYLGGAIVIGALASAALGGAIKHLLP